MDVGAELRVARERQGLSLHELSERTKIGVSSLRAIENNDIERLPGGIFTRGFLKAYAREVGLDPGEATARYTSQFEPPPQGPEAPSPRVAATTDAAESEAADISRYSGAISAAAAVALVAACFFVLGRLQTVDTPGAEIPVAATAVASGPTEVGTAGVAAAPATANDATLRVDLHATGECWMSATADGRRVVYRLMQPGERQPIDVREALALRIGDAANCGYSINGAPGRQLGGAGQAVSVTITPANYRDFIRR